MDLGCIYTLRDAYSHRERSHSKDYLKVWTEQSRELSGTEDSFLQSMHFVRTNAAYAWLVGFLWGATYPLVKRGTLIASSRSGISPFWAHLSTPAFILPQVANQAGSALFIYLLGVSDISSVVPVANAISILFNALIDVAIGETYCWFSLIPGLILVFIGVVLCGLPN